MITTIGALIHHQPTTSQYEILQRADVIFAGLQCGRYYCGVLTCQEVVALIDGVELNERLKQALLVGG